MQVAKDTAPSIPAVAAACGLEPADTSRSSIAGSRATPRTVTAFSQGVNQSSAGTDKVNAIVNVHLATGRIGKPGAGPFSLTGQPNAMGGREVGGLANQLAAHMDFAPEHVDRVRRFWNAPAIATRPGLKAVDLFAAIEAGTVKAVWIMATNPVVSMPDADRVRRALERCELVIVSDCVRDTDTTALRARAAAGRRLGREVRHRDELRAADLAAARVPRAAGRGRAGLVDRDAKSRAAWASAPRSTIAAPADIFREHARLSAFENDGARAFDIGALRRAHGRRVRRARAACRLADALRRRARDRAPQRPFADGRFFTADGKARFVATRAARAARARRAPSGRSC